LSNNPKVAILLSTYNGERFLAEQLDSLINQTYQNTHIYIRDDGSSDLTLSILRGYCNSYPERISLFVGNNCGVIESFNILMQDTESELYATCDQDDIWMPNKIMEQVLMFEDSSLAEGSPFMCFSDPLIYGASSKSEFVLSDIQSMNVEKLVSNYKNLIAMNPVAGCTMLFCDKAKKLYLSSSGRGIIMHDHLMAVLVSHYGKLCFCKNSHVYYRQHELNVMGNKDTSMRYFCSRLRNIKSLIHHDLVLLNTIHSSCFDRVCHVARKVYLNILRFGGFR
jgi:rhamnosyltransferase